MSSTKPLPPGSTIGILGGGQLGRMTALAAARLGYRCVVYSPEETFDRAAMSPPAMSGAPTTTRPRWPASPRQVDVITYEFENVPEATVAECQRHKPVRPGVKPIHLAQHRLREKEFFRTLGIDTARIRRSAARPTSPPPPPCPAS